MALPDGGERRTGSTGTPRETETPRNRQAMRPNRFLPKERPGHFPGRFPILFGRIPENIWLFFAPMRTPSLAEESGTEGRRPDAPRPFARLPRNLYAGNRNENPQERACARGGNHGTDRTHVADRHHEGEGADPKGDDRGVRRAGLLRRPRGDQELLQGGPRKGACRPPRPHRRGGRRLNDGARGPGAAR